MKFWLLLVVLLLPCLAAADGIQVYEAENAALSGSNCVVTDTAASGGRAVEKFESEDAGLEFLIEVPCDGLYDLRLTGMGIGSSKINKVFVDGVDQGTFRCPQNEYGADTVQKVLFSKGLHRVKIVKSWGWIRLDKLEVIPTQAIPADAYQVSKPLCNPNANEAARHLYDYLRECYGKVTLSGQVCADGMDGAEFKAIYEVTGRYPAILGLDMRDYTPSRQEKGARSKAVEHAIAFHRAGGIVTFCWHWNAPNQYLLDGTDENGNPRWWGGCYTKNSCFDLAAVLEGRDPVGKALLDRDIAQIASCLLELQKAGVPVLWRPLHEAAQGWFWWGASGAESYCRLWIYLYEMLTKTYGCNNLIWVWNAEDPAWYPGDAYVDVIAQDIYASRHSYSAHSSSFAELMDTVGQGQIIAMSENGVVFDAEQMAVANTRWAWFCTWSGEYVLDGGTYSDEYTEKAMLIKTYNSDSVITLDELPFFR